MAKKCLTLKKNAVTVLFFSLILFLPSNLFLNLTEQGAFLGGLRIDYLIPKLYLSQILIWCGVGATIFYHKPRKKLGVGKNSAVAGLWLMVGILVARQFFVTQPVGAVWFTFQTLTNLAFTWLIWQHTILLQKSSFYWAVFASLVLQVALAVFQFTQQRPLLPYYVLGEPRFEPYFRMSRHLFSGGERILAYGSTPHPNILAGVCVVFLLLLIKRAVQQKSLQALIRAGLATVATGGVLLMTQSFSALLALLGGGSVLALASSGKTKKFFSPKVVLLLVAVVIIAAPALINHLAQIHPNEPSLTRRAQLNQAAWQIFLDNPVWGVGLNQFTLYLEEYGATSDISRFVQPVHHVGLLLLSETGLLGTGILILFLLKTPKELRQKTLVTFITLSPIIVLDHYIYTLQLGQMIIVLFTMHSLLCQLE